jgi:hypothetical protein
LIEVGNPRLGFGFCNGDVVNGGVQQLDFKVMDWWPAEWLLAAWYDCV